jgi:hypothetical protein
MMQSLNFTDWAGLVLALGGLLVALGGFAYAGRQLLFSQRSARGTFLLDLEEVLRYHDKVHLKLDSADGENWNPAPDEWPAVEAYMGVFERIQLLIDWSILDIETVDRLYSYRILNIVNNDYIAKEKLGEKAQFWPDFCRLWQSLEHCQYWKRNLTWRAQAADMSTRHQRQEGGRVRA